MVAKQGRGNGTGGAGGTGGVGRAGLGGGSGAEVALYLSGGDQEVVSFVLKNCEYSGATISSSLELSA